MDVMQSQGNKSDDSTSTSDIPVRFFRELQIEFLLHELKDPCSVIEAGVRSLLERRERLGPLSQKQERTLKRVLRSAVKTQVMLNGLLEIGRSEEGCFACGAFHPAQALRKVLLEALEATGGVAFEEFREWKQAKKLHEFLERYGVWTDIPSRLNDVRMVQDETKFCQIVGNLVKNALHHRRTRVDVRVDVQDRFLRIEVEDDGPGIKPEHSQYVFRRYSQVNPEAPAGRKGHGLGLAGALILARRLGGDIHLESGEGAGAVFRLTLPLELSADLRQTSLPGSV